MQTKTSVSYTNISIQMGRGEQQQNWESQVEKLEHSHVFVGMQKKYDYFGNQFGHFYLLNIFLP